MPRAPIIFAPANPVLSMPWDAGAAGCPDRRGRAVRFAQPGEQWSGVYRSFRGGLDVRARRSRQQDLAKRTRLRM